MRLRGKLILILAVFFLLFALVSQFALQNVVEPSFERLERQEAVKDLDRCTDAIHREIFSLSIFVRTWSAWDDAYQFLQDHNQPFIQSNCPPETFTNNNLNLIWFIDESGKLVWGETRDGDGKLIQLNKFTAASLASEPELTRFTDPQAWDGGIVMTDFGPMLIVSRPIVTSHNEGPIRGVLLMGRLFQADETKELAEQTHVQLASWALTGGAMPASEAGNLQSSSDWPRLVDGADDVLYAYAVANDIHGKPAMLLRAALPRSMSAEGRRAVLAATITSLIGAGLIMLALWVLIRAAVILPLLRISRHMTEVGAKDNLSVRLNFQRTDEIGMVAREFDRMVGQLAEFRRQVVNTARRAGMADVATGVLHDVGNALNAANISAGVLDERLRQSRVDGLARAADLLSANKETPAFLTGDPRGSKLPQYLLDLNGVLRNEQAESLEYLGRLQESLDHIREIIASQQRLAAGPKMIETQPVAPVIEESLRMFSDTFARSGIAIEKEIGELGDAPMIRVKLMQVLVNLFKNAIDAAPQTGGRIIIRARRVDQRVHIDVTDNGAGIAAENLPLLFTHGFTTKSDGHGFGLHYCANAMKEMGGNLSAFSNGADRGATFTLELLSAAAMPAAGK
jgi:two-component system, NtrC family, sensor kinase